MTSFCLAHRQQTSEEKEKTKQQQVDRSSSDLKSTLKTELMKINAKSDEDATINKNNIERSATIHLSG